MDKAKFDKMEKLTQQVADHMKKTVDCMEDKDQNVTLTVLKVYFNGASAIKDYKNLAKSLGLKCREDDEFIEKAITELKSRNSQAVVNLEREHKRSDSYMKQFKKAGFGHFQIRKKIKFVRQS